MSQPELLKAVVEFLNSHEIPYMLTGSVVSSMQGEPRASHDIDLVVQMSRSDIPQLLAAFSGPQFYLSEAAVEEAIDQVGMFNLLDITEGDKVDFWLLTDEPFDRSRFARQVVEDVLGIRVNVSTPEDTILAKLRWSKLSGGSEKQFVDALRIFELQRGTLDVEYIGQWAEKLDIDPQWLRLQDEGTPIADQ